MTSSSALCTLAGARLISSASSRLVKTGPSETWNSPVALVVDAGADEVGRHQVGGELDPLELAADRLRERLDRHRLGQPGHALDEQVPAGEQRDEHPLQQHVLADDRPLDLVERLLEGRRGGSRSWSMVSTVSVVVGAGRLLLGPAGRAAGGGDRDGEADADEEVLLGRVGQRGDDADHLPGPVEQRAAAVAGVDRGVELDEPVAASGRRRAAMRAVGGRDDAGA